MPTDDLDRLLDHAGAVISERQRYRVTYNPYLMVTVDGNGKVLKTEWDMTGSCCEEQDAPSDLVDKVSNWVDAHSMAVAGHCILDDKLKGGDITDDQ